MCGRYTTLFSWKEVWEFSQPFRGPLEEPRKNFNVAPRSSVPVFLSDEEGPRAAMMQWWFIPSWAKSAECKYSTFNARSEEAATKTTFHHSFRNRRCIIPASGFYEWKKLNDGTKQPYYITRTDGAPLFFAGLWDCWQDSLESCTILTTSPNEEISAIHNRMPCVLEKGEIIQWIDPLLTDPDAAEKMLFPASNGTFQMVPVDNRVGNIRNNDSELIEEKPLS